MANRKPYLVKSPILMIIQPPLPMSGLRNLDLAGKVEWMMKNAMDMEMSDVENDKVTGEMFNFLKDDKIAFRNTAVPSESEKPILHAEVARMARKLDSDAVMMSCTGMFFDESRASKAVLVASRVKEGDMQVYSLVPYWSTGKGIAWGSPESGYGPDVENAAIRPWY